MKQVPSVEAVKEYVRTHATPDYQSDQVYDAGKIVFDAGSVWKAKQSVPINTWPHLDVDNTYWELASGSGTTTVKYPFGDANIKKGMPLAVKEGKLYRASYSEADLVEVVGFALSDYVVGVDKDVQKIGLLKALPPLARNFSIGDEEALYFPLTENMEDSHGVSIGVLEGAAAFVEDPTFGNLVLVSQNSTPSSFAFTAAQRSAVVDMSSGLSLAFEFRAGITGSVEDPFNSNEDILSATFLAADTNNYRLSLRVLDGALCVTARRNDEISTFLSTTALPILVGEHNVVSFIVDFANKRVEVRKGFEVAYVNFSVFSVINLESIDFSTGSCTEISFILDAAINYKNSISQIVGVLGANWARLKDEILLLAMDYFVSQPVFLDTLGSVRYRTDTIEEGYHRVMLGYVFDQTSIDIQMSEPIQVGYVASEVFQDLEEVGCIKILTSGEITSGWIRPDGRAVPDGAYPTLFIKYSALGFPWGRDEVNHTYNVPNYPDPFLMLKARPAYRRIPDPAPDYADKAYVLEQIAGVSGGGAADGNIGFNLNNRQFEAGTSNCALYKNTVASAIPETGTGGAPSVLSMSLFQSSTLALAGTGSLMLSKSASSGLGEGLSQPFTIDRGNRASLCQITFMYETSSGYTHGDVSLFLYDIDGSSIIPISVSTLPATYGSPSQFLAVFIPKLTSKNYRIIFHCSSASAVAWTAKLDNLQIGQKSLTVGGAIGAYKTIANPTIYGEVTNPTKGTVVNDSLVLDRNGESLLGVYTFTQTVAGSGAGSGVYSLKLPDGLLAHTANISTGSDSPSTSKIGSGTLWSAATGTYTVDVVLLAADRLGFVVHLTSTSTQLWGASNFPLSGGGVYCSVSFRVPKISQWLGGGTVGLVSSYEEYASNSDVSPTSSVTGSGFLQGFGNFGGFGSGWATGTSWTRRVKFANPIQWGRDTLSLGQVEISTGKTLDDVTKGGNIQAHQYQSLTEYGYTFNPVAGDPYSVDIGFNAGGRLTSAAYGSNGSSFSDLAGSLKWFIKKTSAGKPGEALPVVRAEYFRNSSLSLEPSRIATYIFNQKMEDTHGSYSSSTGEFTCVYPGVYCLSASGLLDGITVGTTVPAGAIVELSLYYCKNGGEYEPYKYLARWSSPNSFVVAVSVFHILVAGEHNMRLGTGDKIKVIIVNQGFTGGVPNTFGSAQYERITIDLIGK